MMGTAMKRNIGTAIIAGFMTVSLAACGGGDSGDPAIETVEAEPVVVPADHGLDGAWKGMDRTERVIGELPLNPVAAEYAEKYNPDMDPQNICVPSGLARLLMSPLAFDLAVHDDYVHFHHSDFGFVRDIPLSNLDPVMVTRTLTGEATATFDGNTLIVKSTGLTAGIARARNTFFPIGPNATITERYFRDGENLIQEIELADPDYLTGPWTYKWNLSLLDEPVVAERDCDPLESLRESEEG